MEGIREEKMERNYKGGGMVNLWENWEKESRSEYKLTIMGFPHNRKKEGNEEKHQKEAEKERVRYVILKGVRRSFVSHYHPRRGIMGS